MKVVSALLVAMLASLFALAHAKPAVLTPFPFERVEVDCRSQACSYDSHVFCTAKKGWVIGTCQLQWAVCRENDVQISCVEMVSGEK